ncbi:MAG: hypothetical protein AAB953_02875 [Patescibacteria group bacterium]
MSENFFSELLKSSNIISGKFDFRSNGEYLMDLDVVNKQFISCEIIGGDFASGSFVNCTFDKVLFKNSSMVGVNFDKCCFADCRFSNVESDFSMRNCEIKKFSITRGDF